jgi:acetyl-CoA carboxylase beta subunit
MLGDTLLQSQALSIRDFASRVVRDTTGKIPEGFQTSGVFLLEHGFVITNTKKRIKGTPLKRHENAMLLPHTFLSR